MARKLIIGYDGSDNAGDALSLGALLAECLAASPLVALAAPDPDRLLGPDGAPAPAAQVTEPILARAAERLAGLDAELRTIVGESPARALHELAEEVEPVAVVVGSAHRGRVGRVLLGSVGTALLSGAPSPIAVAPGGYAEREQRRVASVGVAVSGSEESWPALAAAIGLAGRLRASLTVLGVVEPVHLSYGGEYPAVDLPAYQRASTQRMTAVLDEAVGRAPAGLATERRLLAGDPPAAIAEAAGDFDLLVLGSRAYGPVRRALLGSVSAKLMAVAPCPVLVLPRTAGTDPLGLGEA